MQVSSEPGERPKLDEATCQPPLLLLMFSRKNSCATRPCSSPVVGPKVIALDDRSKKGGMWHSCSNHDLYWNVPQSEKSLLQRVPGAPNAQFKRLACPMGAPTLLYGRCRRTDTWRLCRIFTRQEKGVYTVMWTDGTLQNRTKSGEGLFRPHADHRLEESFQSRLRETNECRKQSSNTHSRPPSRLPVSDESNSQETVICVQGMSVWEAVRQGNLVNALYLIDHEGVSPSAVCDEEPHTPLYWAVTQINVDFVRELLERGARGEDAVNVVAVIPSVPVKAQRRRRRPFFPGTVSQWVHRSQHGPVSLSSRDHARQLIRAMIVASQSDLRLPRQIFRNEQQTDCIVCYLRPATAIGLPCAHLACCLKCLEQSPRCPLCRTKVLAIAE